MEKIMNANKPVAWMMKSNDPDYVSDYIMFKTPERKDKISHHAIPLYTATQSHPVKELTDEEIRHIQAQCHLKDVGYDGFIMRFARAILRKAQEK